MVKATFICRPTYSYHPQGMKVRKFKNRSAAHFSTFHAQCFPNVIQISTCINSKTIYMFASVRVFYVRHHSYPDA